MAISSLITALKDPALSTRKEAKSSLIKLGAAAQKALIDALIINAEKDKELSYLISRVLADFGKDVVSDLIDLLKSCDDSVLSSVSLSLQLIGHEAVPGLLTILKNKDRLVRIKAAKTLERMESKAKDAIPVLCYLLNDFDEEVRFRAGFALGVIGADPSKFVPVLESLAPPLEDYEVNNLYWNRSIPRAHITKKNPIFGEIVYSRGAMYSLCPEKEYQCGNGGGIWLRGKTLSTADYGSGLVAVSGFYEKGSGFLTTCIVDAC